MQGHLALMHRLAAGYLGVAQSAGAAYPYSLGASLDGAENRLFYRPPVSNAALNLFGDCFGYQSGIKLGLTDFLNV